MAQTKYTCKDCVLFNNEDPESPYCMGKDLYTYVNPDDEACEDAIPLDYTCKDCFFFKYGVCYHSGERLFTPGEWSSCSDFEYKKINVKL